MNRQTNRQVRQERARKAEVKQGLGSNAGMEPVSELRARLSSKWRAALVALAVLIPARGVAEAVGEGMQPYTWDSLSTLAGATAATLMIVEFVKAPLDRVWYIPTRLLTYLVAAAILLTARAFTSGVSVQGVILSLVDAILVALSAYGSYELTFAKKNKST